jgi:hypothetical protein
MANPLRTETFDCVCNSFDHAIRFQFDPTEDDVRCQEIWLETAFPTYRPWYQRLVMAAKYVLFSHVRDYTSGSWILKHEDYSRLRNFFIEYDMAVWKLKEKEKLKVVETVKVGENESKSTDGMS